MWRLIRFLITGYWGQNCNHKWVENRRHAFWIKGCTRPVKRKVELQCKHCGNVKSVTVT